MEKANDVSILGDGTEAHLVINDPIFERNTETILCTFIKNKKKSEWVCRMAIRVKNISSTLISKIGLCTKVVLQECAKMHIWNRNTEEEMFMC